MEKINGLIHKIPSTSMCCCCIDLRTGGLIIGGLRLFGFISLLIVHFSWFLLLFLLVDISWIYGIIAQKPIFMLPEILTLILAFILIAIVLYIIAGFLLVDAGIGAVLGVTILIIPFLAYVIHLFLVQVSLYKVMTEQPPVSVEATTHSVEYKTDLVQEDV